MSASNADPSRMKPALPMWLLLAGLVAAVANSQFHLSHDNSWYLIATRRFMEGARLYIDIIEINPPLAFYLTVPGLAIADWTGLSDKVGYVFYISALATLANFWALSIVRRSTLSAGDQRLLAIAAPVVTLLLPIAEFGQREHLMLVFTLPYFYAAVLGKHDDFSPIERIAIGLFASLGLALKPYFYLAPFALALLAIWRERRLGAAFSVANITIALATLAYAGFIWLRHPEYATEIVPIATSVYHSYGLPVWKRLAQPTFFALPMLILFVQRKKLTDDKVAQDFAAIGLAFLASYLIQFKGFNYHILPAAAYLLLTAIWLSVRHAPWLRTNIFAATLVMMALIGSLGHQLIRGPYQPWSSQPFARFVPQDGMRVLVISSNVSAAFPFTNDVNGEWTSKYPAQWLIPGSLLSLQEADCASKPAECERLEAIQRKARTDLVGDLDQRRPQVVFVDEWEDKPHFRGLNFDYVDYLSGDPRFAEVWARYERVGKTHGFRVYRLRGTKAPTTSSISTD